LAFSQAWRNLASAIVVKYSSLVANGPGLERPLTAAVESSPSTGLCCFEYWQIEAHVTFLNAVLTTKERRCIPEERVFLI
jgi:hypothetical protein